MDFYKKWSTVIFPVMEDLQQNAKKYRKSPQSAQISILFSTLSQDLCPDPKMSKVYKNINRLNIMTEIKDVVRDNYLNTMNLEELTKYREEIDERIGAMKGKESLKYHKGYTSNEVKNRLLKCLRK